MSSVELGLVAATVVKGRRDVVVVVELEQVLIPELLSLEWYHLDDEWHH